MGFKKSISYIFILFLAFAFILLSNDARSEENKWKFAGKTKDKSYLVYYDTASVDYIRKDYVSLRLKKELSEEGIERFKKNFYASVKEAEDKAGEKVSGPVGPILKALLERETKEYLVEIDCATNEIRVPPSKMGQMNFVIVDDIESGTTAEYIRNDVCPKQLP
ncbi:MAG: hypothetical protein HQL08_12240 [Nitrospirae bacterium]|nr:hypothetical protein [Nitrospirota bacterium]